MNSTIHKLIKSFLTAILFLSVNYSNAQVSITATAGTTGPTAYTTVNAALAAITAGTHQGAIIITITGNTTEPAWAAANQLVASGTGLANYQSVRIVPQGNVVVNSALTPSANRGVLEFIGADSITIDGDDPLTPGTRNLTFQVATTTSTYTSALRFSSSAGTANTGCRAVTVRNCIIIGGRNSATINTIGFGITASGGSNATLTTVTTSAQDNDNMVIENNEFKRCYYGFHAYGGTTNVMDSLVIRNNKFGNDTSAINMGLFGIYLGYTALTASNNSAIIEGNEIQGGDYGTTGWAANIAGINLVAGNAGAIIRNNNIHDISQPSTGGYGAYGIFLSSATSNVDIHIFNNFIRGVRMYTYQSSTTSTWQPIGIFVNAGITGLRINHNTIVMPTQLFASATFSSHGVLLNSAATLSEFNNNIIVNQYASSAGYAVTSNGVGNYSTANMDRNNYLVAGSNIGFANGTARSNLAAWRTATLKDTNSFNINPPFISATNLRLQNGVKTALESNGAVTSVTSDIDGQVRPGPAGSVNGGGTAPDIGADEADMIPDNYSYDSTLVTQITGQVPPSSIDNPVIRIAVYVSGSIGALPSLSNVYLNTAGTTTAANISNAKLYFTGNSATFNTSTPFGSTVSTPSGAYGFTGTQVLAAGINYFWVAYDVASGATTNNLLDARLDSITVSSINRIPSNGNPSGALTVVPPMTYVSSSASHSILSKVETGSDNNVMLRIPVIMSSTGSPVFATQLDLSTNGGANPLTNIDSIIVWYTGNNPNFAFPIFFGGTGPQSGSYAITGSRSLLNDTNYFWLTYKIKTTATVGDSVDAEITSITIQATAQTPVGGAPAGSRLIRSPYCQSAATSAVDGEIWNVTVGGLNFTSSCLTTGGTNSVLNMYSNYTTLINPVNIVKGLPIPFSVNTSTCNGNYDGVLGIWIDLNDDGDFTDPGEEMHMSGVFQYGPTVFRTGNISIPCGTINGVKRMRVTLIETTFSPITPCGTYGYGETEDYLVNIIDATPSFVATTTIQQTGSTSPSSTNLPVLRIPVKVMQNVCNPSLVTEFRFNTAGTTAAGDIAAAKLYKTGASSTFNTSNLLGTVTSPSGAFGFIISDTAINDTNNYWLAYDISGSATNNNVVDARFDSAAIFGGWRIPSVSAPAGNIIITSPMSYVSSDVVHPTLSKVERGQDNSQIARIQIRMSSIGSTVPLTQFNLSTNGSANPISNIDSIIVWYTGNNPNFVTPTVFGSTGSQSGAFIVSGSQNMLNDTNYFWVSYNIRDTAIVGDSVDIEVTSVTINSTVQTPTTTAPIGARLIRGAYCASNATTTFDGEIFNVTVGSLNNTTDCITAATGPGSVLSQYSNFTNTVAAPNLIKGTPIPFSVNTATCGSGYDGVMGIWIDLNDDGDFTDSGETVHMTPVFVYGVTVFRTGNIVIPCSTTPGLKRMRVSLIETTTSPIAPCGTFGYGETEDYVINVVESNPTYLTSLAIQQTGSTSAGSTNVPVLRIPVRVVQNNCSPSLITEIRFNTIGTTSVADITSAKLYKTGTSSAFSTTNLIGTVTSPSGAFSFIINDTALNDTNNYWLAYDISGTAVNNNVVDARFDSAQVFGNWRLPSVSAPAGSVLISTPMSYLSSTSVHPTFQKISTGSINNQMLRIRVITSSTGAPIPVTQFDLNTNGSVNTGANIDSIIVWYTGANANFASPVFFGSTGSQTGAYAITGFRNLLNDTNYFWLTYNVRTTANVGDSLDAEVTSITVGGSAQTPSVTAPAGSREIKAQICVPVYSFACTSDDLINNVSTTGGSTNITNLGSGCNGNVNNYIYYPNQTVTVVRGGSFTINYQSGINWDQGFKIYIDYNDDGDFTDAGELVANAPSSTNLNTSIITIPLNAVVASLRMRVRCAYGTEPASPCGTEAYGETEDYNVSVLAAPAPTTYVWNQTSAASFTVAGNWTPSRTNTNLNDKLVFSSGGVRVVNNVPQQTVDVVRVENNTTVQLNTASIGNLAATDSLSLVSGKIVTGTDVTVTSGSNSSYINRQIRIGNITGAGYVNGVLQRWIDTVASVYTFPIRYNDTVRTVIMDYTAGPSAAGTITVQFVPGNPGNAGLPVTDNFVSLNKASENGVWRINQANGLVGGTYNLSLSGNQFRGIVNTSSISVIRRLNNVSNWSDSGTYTATTGSTTSPVFNRSGLTVYGEFTAASDTLSNPLPVSLLEFNAKPSGEDVLVYWTTVSEINNKGFHIERSIDGNQFEGIQFVEGAIQSNTTINYQELDNNAFAVNNTLYYRLRQVDLDGTETLSQVVQVSKIDAKATIVTVAPNPFTFNTVLTINSVEESNVGITITDIQGRIIATKNLAIQEGSNYIKLNELEAASDGVYFIKVSGNLSETIKVVKYTN
jgi:hypothetical protein